MHAMLRAWGTPHWTPAPARAQLIQRRPRVWAMRGTPPLQVENMKIRTIIAAASVTASTGVTMAQSHYTATPITSGQLPPLSAPTDSGPELDWNTIDGGGRVLSAGAFSLAGTVGQADAGDLNQGAFTLSGGFWPGVESVPVCYANCDASTGTPQLTANDFQCFLNRYTAGDIWANCDGSTVQPVLNINDFQCFLNKFAGGCSQ